MTYEVILRVRQIDASLRQTRVKVYHLHNALYVLSR